MWVSDGCEGYETSVSVHPPGGLTHTFIQAMTVFPGSGMDVLNTGVNADTDPANDINTNYAFFVSPLAGGSITPYVRRDVQVEVYDYHEGQDDLYSIYKPRHTFRIQAAASTQTTPEDAYWHVFNMVRTYSDGEFNYEIQQFGLVDSAHPERGGQGTIESGFGNVQCNIPGHYCNLTESGENVPPPATILPDFAVTSLTVSPDRQDWLTNDAVTMTGIIQNQGTGAAAAARYQFCIDESDCATNPASAYSAGTLPILAVAGSQTFTTTFFPDDLGQVLNDIHYIRLCTDVNTEITESDETNNCRVATFLRTWPVNASGVPICVDGQCPSYMPICNADGTCSISLSVVPAGSPPIPCEFDWQCPFDLLNPMHCEIEEDALTGSCAFGP
ncbi:MAG: CARDB domain-containing protein [Patescibacteria group bacterium]